MRVESGIRVEPGGAVQFALSADGSLVYLAGSGAGGAMGQLVWVDQSGAETVFDAPARPYQSPQVSPDGTRVAVEIERDIWIWDGPGRLDRLTLSEEDDDNPLWLDDGQVAFRSNRDGGGIFMQPSDGTAEAVRLLDTPARPWDATPQGAVLYYTTPGTDIGVVTAEDAGAGELLVATAATETRPVLSPNGRWLAYASNELGQLEIYVRGYPDGASLRRLVSTAGGNEPRWAPDGQTLYYRGPDGLMAVAVVSEEPFAVRTPEPLFAIGDYATGVEPIYDVAPDGRFIFVRSESGEESDAGPTDRLVVVQNFFDELRRLVPTN